MVPIEPIGVSIGAISLAALFSTCVQCFEYIESAKRHGKDYTFLITKLNIQKTRLLIWGKQVGLTNLDGPIERLWWWEHPLCRPVVQSVLECIHIIFEDTDQLTKQYGLKQLKEPHRHLFHRRRDLALHPATFASLINARIDERQRQTNTVKKTRWAIHDKAKFENMINDLRQFIDGLEQITQPLDVERRRKKSLRDGIRAVLFVKRLRHGLWKITCNGTSGTSSEEDGARRKNHVHGETSIDDTGVRKTSTTMVLLTP